MKYNLLYSSRKTLSLEIRPGGEILVRAPHRFPKRKIEQFLREKSNWIDDKLRKQEKRNLEQRMLVPTLTPSEQRKLHQQAITLFHEKANFFGARLGVQYNRIFVKSQKTRFGSCSSKKNLNFNQCLLFAPERVLDYVVIHELCHLKEMNHSPAFWALVEREMPDYKVWRKWLKDFGHQLH